MSFTNRGNAILTFFLNLLFYSVSYIHLYYFKKFTNLPVYSGLTNPYRISLKTKDFVLISLFSTFLPKIFEPTCTSEYLTLRRYKKTLKLLEIYRAMTFEPG